MTDLHRYPVPGSDFEVELNLALEQPHVSPKLTDEVLRTLISSHERIRLREYWEEVLLAPAKAGQGLEGLSARKGGDGLPVFAYFRSSALQTQSGTALRGVALSTYLRALPMADQKRFVLALMPETREGLQGVVRNSAIVFGPDFQSLALSFESPRLFVEHLVECVRSNGLPLYHAPRYLELLILLWDANFLLFPLDLRSWSIRSKWALLRNARFTPQKGALVTQVTRALKGTDTSELQGWAYVQLAASSVVTDKDFSPALIGDYEARLQELAESSGVLGTKLFSLKSFIARVAQTFRLLFNQAHPELAVTQTRTPKKSPAKGIARGDGKFMWLEHARPALSEWADLMRKYVAQLTTARIEGQVGRLNHFADYLLTLEDAPATPLAVSRVIHIHDATLRNSATYTEYLRTKVKNKTTATAALSLLREFFDWYADYLLGSGRPESAVFKNPVLLSDTLGRGRGTRGQTPRNALPGYVLDELKTLLSENDFAFGKSFTSHYVRVIDSQTGKPTRVWFPGPTICLYLMLEAPVRSQQARWLDSGELDEFRYNTSTNSLARNCSPHAVPGRRQAALRLQHDSLRKSDWFGLWVNTNKTALYDSTDVGYCIPYVSDKLSALLTTMTEWQERYAPPMLAPIPYYGNKHGIVERERISGKGPQVVPLFRDPAARTPGAPIAYDRLVTFYTSALAEVQARIKRKHGHDLQLVEEGPDGKLTWLVDLHTLRVSGITAMIESGVPLEVVSMFVAGHATLVMTLHYLKFSPLKLRAMLEDAHEKSLENMDFVGSEMFMEHLDTFAPYMLGQAGAGQGAGFGALREKTGILTITSEGICPGTSCSTGGPVDSTRVQHGPVPGGQRCGLCRYWITGPAHLLGQVAAVNNLAYAIRKKGQEVASLNDARLDAEDSGNQKKARKLRDRVDVLNRELAIDVEEWAARYRYAEQSVAQLDEFLKSKAAVEGVRLPMPLLTAGTAAELKVTLEEAHEFALLDQITQTSDFVTGFRNREAELEKNAILSKMLEANGLKPFLLSLSTEQAHEAGNLLSALILQQVRTQELDEVLAGRTKISAYPQLAKTLTALESATDDGQLLAIRTNLLALEGAPEQEALTNNEMSFA